MLKLKNGAMLVVAALCGYLALMTPDWKSDLVADSGPVYESDMNGDEVGDFLWRREDTKEMRLWTADPTLDNGNYVTTPLTGISFFPQYNLSNNNWKVVALGDIDGDADMDIIFRNIGSGYNRSWIMGPRPNGITTLRESLTFFPQYESFDTSIVGMGDCNGDGTEDLYFYNSATGVTRIWIMNFLGQRSGVGFFPVQGNLNMEVQAVGDFDNDGDADIFWRDTTTGANAIWDVDSSTCGRTAARSVAAEATLTKNVVAAADMDEDGAEDLIWVDSANRAVTAWDMSAGVPGPTVALGTHGAGWAFAGIMDNDGDGAVNNDIVWHDSAAGRVRTWKTDGAWNITSTAVSRVFSAGSAWEVINDRND